MVSSLENDYIFLFDTLEGTLTGTTTLDHSEHGSNGNEGVLHIPHISRTGATPSDSFVSYLGYSV